MQIKDGWETNPDTKERLRKIATFSTALSLPLSHPKNLLSPFEEKKTKLIVTEVEKTGAEDTLRPIIARIYLTSFCNHNCSGCSFTHNQKREGGFLNTSYFRKLIDDLHSMNIQLVDLTGGGEPTLHPQFVELVKMCRDRESQLALLSNGTWGDPRLFDLLADGFSFLRVNLDASSGEVYERIHHPPRKGEFQRVMHNLERVISEKERRKSGLIVGAKVRLSQANMNYVEGMITLTKDLGLDYIQFHTHPDRREALLPEQRRNVLRILNELKNKHHSPLIYARLEVKKNGERCWASGAQLTIDASGNLYSCPHFLNQPDLTYLGNFLNRNVHDQLLDYDKEREPKDNSSRTCSVENCRWRFYDEVICQRIKAK